MGIFGAKRHEITGEWRKLYNAELHALYYSPNINRNLKIEKIEMGWAHRMYGVVQKCI